MKINLEKEIRYIIIAIFVIFVAPLGFLCFQSSYATPEISLNDEKPPSQAFSGNYEVDDNKGLLLTSAANQIIANNVQESDKIDLQVATPNATDSKILLSLDKFMYSQDSQQGFYHYQTNDSVFPLYKLQGRLKVAFSNETFDVLSDNPIVEKDLGLVYLLRHGYNITSSVNTVFDSEQYGIVPDDDTKQYITQAAIFLYLARHKDRFADRYCILLKDGVNVCDFDEYSVNDITSSIEKVANYRTYQYFNYINLLLENAEVTQPVEQSAMDVVSSSDLNYTLDLENGLITSDFISPVPIANNNNYLNYSVTISDPNHYGVYLVDENNQQIGDLENQIGSFRICIPIREDVENMDLYTVQIKITGHFFQSSLLSYRVTNSSQKLLDKNKDQVFSDVMLGYVVLDDERVNYVLNGKNMVIVKKTEGSSDEQLAGALLEIKDKNSERSWQWVSDIEPYYLMLENGEYTLCELEPPEGYQLNPECIDFSVNGKDKVMLSLPNTRLVTAPNTNRDFPKVLYVIGGISILVGLGIFIYSQKLKRN